MTNVIGIDLGGTKIAAARYATDDWQEDSPQRITTPKDGIDSVVQAVSDTIEELSDSETVGVGIGVPGLVERSTGTVLHMPNINGGKNVALASKLQQYTSLPLFVDNDANCFALAESVQGAGGEHDVVVAVTIGTGVGGGIVIRNTILHGAHGYAGEFGHLLLQPGQLPYESADTRGTVEQYISGTAMGKRCEAAGRPEEYLHGDVCSFMQPDIFREVAWLCTNLIHALDPSVIIFGGSAGRSLQPHLQTIAEELRQWVLPGTPLPELTVATLSDSSTRGAALLTQSA